MARGKVAVCFDVPKERGCVKDQPQRVGSPKRGKLAGVLRLVEDDTAALLGTMHPAAKTLDAGMTLREFPGE